MEKNRIAIVVPTYKTQLSELEMISLRQLHKVMKGYDVYYVVPDSIDFEADNGKVLKLDKKWFASVRTYSCLLLSEYFYNLFTGYEYILIYQLDAFVFYDRLQYFCDLGFDYYGAPWLQGEVYYKNSNQCLWYVGNGGFSLRNVKACISVLKNEVPDMDVNEDLFWASSSLTKPPVDIALQFAFEMNVEKCYRMNHSQIPFGCHAWERHHFSFWKPLIEKEGYYFSGEILGEQDKINCDINRSYLVLPKDKIKSRLKKIFDPEREIVIWGAGRYGKECGWLLNYAGINFKAYTDTDVKKQEKEVWGHSVLSPEIILSSIDRYTIIISVKRLYEEIINNIKRQGYQVTGNIIPYGKIVELLLDSEEKHG